MKFKRRLFQSKHPPGFDSQSGVMMKPWLDAGQAKPSTNTWPAGRFQWQWQVGLWSRNLETELENKTQRIISHYNVLQRSCLHFKCKTWKFKFSHRCVCTPQDLEGGKLLIWQGKIYIMYTVWFLKFKYEFWELMGVCFLKKWFLLLL